MKGVYFDLKKLPKEAKLLWDVVVTVNNLHTKGVKVDQSGLVAHYKEATRRHVEFLDARAKNLNIAQVDAELEKIGYLEDLVTFLETYTSEEPIV
jgi:hypothetical protein